MAIQSHLLCYFQGILLQLGIDDVTFVKKYSLKVKNNFIGAQSQHQWRFSRKPHIKSSFRCGGVVGRSHRQTDRQTDRHPYFINIMGIVVFSAIWCVHSLHDLGQKDHFWQFRVIRCAIFRVFYSNLVWMTSFFSKNIR